MLDPFSIGPRELGFSWIDNNGKYHCWMTERMNNHAIRTGMEIIQVGMDLDYAEHVARFNGIEKHRLDRITPQVLAQKPILYIEMGDGTHKLVDGNHRYLKAAELGWDALPAYCFSKELSDDFKLDIPEHMNERCKGTVPKFSGIL
jgi:hypothetical protein